MLYRVRVGRDEYLGTPGEVLAFLSRAEGAPGRDARAYMAGVARRLSAEMGVVGIPTDDAEAFLLALGARRVIHVERAQEPLTEREDPHRAVGDGPVVYGAGVDPDDLAD